MLYIVSSISRSGSSMAMQCLIVGGLSAAYDDSQGALNIEGGDADYIPNPGGFYALNDDFGATFFSRHDGRLVKVPWRSLVTLPPGAYSLLFMLRDPKEIAASMNRVGDDWGGERAVLEVYEKATDELFTQLRSRGDMNVKTLKYADVVGSPEEQFGSLSWPINAKAAASIVDESLHRFRLERL